MKKKRKINGGFTLVELLATLAILSLVLSIVIYTTVGIVDTGKEKGYATTVNNVKVAAGNYVLENATSPDMWTSMSNGDNCKSEEPCEFQCVKVLDLVEKGYFSSDMLNSPINKDEQLGSIEYIYVERDPITKTITYKDLYYGSCMNPYGSISFVYDNSEWTNKDLEVKIQYEIKNIGRDYELSYYYDADASIKKEGIKKQENYEETVSIKNAGTLVASIELPNGETVSHSAPINPKIDKVAPYVMVGSTRATVDATNMPSKYPDLIIQASAASSRYGWLTDSDSGLDEFYYGTENPENSNVSYTKFEEENSKKANFTIERIKEPGTWYVAVKDKAGNLTIDSITFFRTDFEIEKGNVSYSFVISGSKYGYTDIPESLKLPDVKDECDEDCLGVVTGLSSSYYVLGWYSDEDCNETRYGFLYMPKENSPLYSTLYGCVEKDDEGSSGGGGTGGGSTPSVTYYKVTFNANGGSPTPSIQTITSGGKVQEPTAPQKNGYTFDGWYNGSTKWNFSTDTVKSNLTLTAKFTAESVEVPETPSCTVTYSCPQYYNLKGTMCMKQSHYVSGGRCYLKLSDPSGITTDLMENACKYATDPTTGKAIGGTFVPSSKAQCSGNKCKYYECDMGTNTTYKCYIPAEESCN